MGTLLIEFVEGSKDKGRYKRRQYDVVHMGFSHVGIIHWHYAYGWIFTGAAWNCHNVLVLDKVSAFMKTLPVYKSGKPIPRSEKGY